MSPPDRYRVAVAGCFHETNTFAAAVTDVAAFQRRDGWLHDDALVEAYAGTRTVMGGMLDGAAEHGLEVLPVFGAYATPAGLVTSDAFHRVEQELVNGLRGLGDFDGLLLELHGAMVVEGHDDPETVLLEEIRQVLGPRPIVVVTDLHANMTPRRAELVDALVGYRTNPHVDTYESGFDAARHLRRLLDDDLKTVVLHRRVAIVAAPIAQRTAELPLLRVLAAARQLERRHRLVDVTVHGGYAYADVAHAGMSLTVTAPADRASEAEEVLEQLAVLAWQHREEFQVQLPSPEAAVAEAVRIVDRHGGPVAVVDTGDNINGGSPGDTTWLLHQVADRPGSRTAATLWDPAAVVAAAETGVGGHFRAELGGKAESMSGPPLTGDAEVRWVGDGQFVNRGPMAHGARVSMGAAAVVRLGHLDIVLQSLPVQPNDPELFRSVALDPADYQLVLLKGAAAVRAGWEPIVTSFVDAGTRGVTDCDLQRLPYQALRDVWPLSASPPSRKETPS